MAVGNYDAVSALYNWLRTGTGAAPIRALVYDGTNGIYEQADLKRDAFTELNLARNTASEREKVLAITVHDVGESYRNGDIIQAVGICLWDIANGQDAMRKVREYIKYYMRKMDDEGLTPITDVVDATRGLVSYKYEGRTGYRQSEYYRAEYDMMTYSTKVSWSE